MLRFRCFVVPFVVATALSLVPRSASADDLVSGGASHGVVSRIKRGVKEVGVESLFATSYDKVNGGSSALQLTVIGGLGFRYFVADNVALALNGGALFDTSDRSGTHRDVAGYGTLSAAYYVAVGGGLMLAPTIGAGGFYGGRTENGTPDLVHATLAGGLARGGLGLVFYPSSRVNLFARPEAIAFFGKATPEATTATPSPTSSSFTRVTGGFTVGANIVF